MDECMFPPLSFPRLTDLFFFPFRKMTHLAPESVNLPAWACPSISLLLDRICLGFDGFFHNIKEAKDFFRQHLNSALIVIDDVKCVVVFIYNLSIRLSSRVNSKLLQRKINKAFSLLQTDSFHMALNAFSPLMLWR